MFISGFSQLGFNGRGSGLLAWNLRIWSARCELSLDNPSNAATMRNMSNIRDEIKNLAAKWINPVYAERFDAAHVLKDLMAHAFLTGVPRHSEEGLLLLEAHKRLQAGYLTGEYAKGDYFTSTS